MTGLSASLGTTAMAGTAGSSIPECLSCSFQSARVWKSRSEASEKFEISPPLSAIHLTESAASPHQRLEIALVFRSVHAHDRAFDPSSRENSGYYSRYRFAKTGYRRLRRQPADERPAEFRRQCATGPCRLQPAGAEGFRRAADGHPGRRPGAGRRRRGPALRHCGSRAARRVRPQRPIARYPHRREVRPQTTGLDESCLRPGDTGAMTHQDISIRPPAKD